MILGAKYPAPYCIFVEIVTSLQNSAVKEARSLSAKKFRRLTGRFIVEGANLLRDMPLSVAVRKVFCTEARLDEAETIAARYDGAQLICVADKVFDSLTDTVTPYGIAAVADIPAREYAPPKGNALLLDAVSDPGNLGTILRTAAACGFEDVYMLECADVFAPKAVRATLGGLFRVRLYEVDEAQAIELVSASNSAALDMDGDDMLKAKISQPILFVAGNEAHGVRNSIRQATKYALSLPMKNDIESLNVAIATAVAMFRTLEE